MQIDDTRSKKLDYGQRETIDQYLAVSFHIIAAVERDSGVVVVLAQSQVFPCLPSDARRSYAY